MTEKRFGRNPARDQIDASGSNAAESCATRNDARAKDAPRHAPRSASDLDEVLRGVLTRPDLVRIIDPFAPLRSEINPANDLTRPPERALAVARNAGASKTRSADDFGFAHGSSLAGGFVML